ncbi:MAG: galactose-1-phosphate uridylyltransferase [Polyangiaceae bacterium]|jgi:UDPglucose--hexose-1-phosphate uridylyltransferase|nr:galactose-1-phosphate uridylyltransferase [Polyangiaceae bacterium]
MRYNPITGDWVIIAPERARRPGVHLAGSIRPTGPSHKEDCPFCVGNEHLTGAERLRIEGPGGWQIRSVENRYSALALEGPVEHRGQGLRATMSGVGRHEVLIETPDHGGFPSRRGEGAMQALVEAYHRRLVAFHEDPRVRHVVIFKNHGSSAGTSLEHPHSQIVGTPVVPAQVRERLVEALRYRSDHGQCLYCATLRLEFEEGARLILINEHFVAFLPYAALSPYHLWVFPKRHHGSFAGTTAEERGSLGSMLSELLKLVARRLADCDYNYVIQTLSPAENEVGYFHWYLALVPRVTRTAGFELGTGMYINTSSPEVSAAHLRGETGEGPPP